jgi:hypothetical protein
VDPRVKPEEDGRWGELGGTYSANNCENPHFFRTGFATNRRVRRGGQPRPSRPLPGHLRMRLERGCGPGLTGIATAGHTDQPSSLYVAVAV